MLITLTYNNFKQYAQQGTVPAVEQNNGSKVLQNSFYKSVYYINSVLWPIKGMLVGVKHDLNTSGITMGRREKVVWGTDAMISILALQIYYLYSIQELHILCTCQKNYFHISKEQKARNLS